jgi:hypothetical protein
MRPLLPGDLDAAARALWPLPPDRWAAEADRLVRAADLADRHRKRLGRSHPAWGDGSLMAAALLMGQRSQPPWCDDSYCAALAAIIAALQRRRQHHRR